MANLINIHKTSEKNQIPFKDNHRANKLVKFNMQISDYRNELLEMKGTDTLFYVQ